MVIEKEYEDLNFVIMMALGKGKPNEFRKDYTKCRRRLKDMYSQ